MPPNACNTHTIEGPRRSRSVAAGRLIERGILPVEWVRTAPGTAILRSTETILSGDAVLDVRSWTFLQFSHLDENDRCVSRNAPYSDLSDALMTWGTSTMIGRDGPVFGEDSVLLLAGEYVWVLMGLPDPPKYSLRRRLGVRTVMDLFGRGIRTIADLKAACELVLDEHERTGTPASGVPRC